MEIPEVDFKLLFQQVKTIAVVGYSDNPERAGHYVAHYLADQGYEVIAVNPKFGDEINGLKNYQSLGDIPAGVKVDLVDVFRGPPVVPGIVEAAAKMEPLPKYFMQPGAENPDAAEMARAEGMIPIMHSCTMAAHKIWK